MAVGIFVGFAPEASSQSLLTLGDRRRNCPLPFVDIVAFTPLAVVILVAFAPYVILDDSLLTMCEHRRSMIFVTGVAIAIAP